MVLNLGQQRQKNPSIAGLIDSISSFRLPPELILDPKYDKKILEWIIFYIQLGH